MVKFKCENCGQCCSKFGKKGLPLFDFEVERIKILAGKRELNILPTEVFLDKKSGKKFAVLYGLFDEPCPFLKDKKCSIYEKRFLICRQFPLFSTGEFKFSKISGLPEFMECKSFDCKKNFSEFLGTEQSKSVQKPAVKETKSLEEVQRYLKEFYGNCFEECLKSNKETEKIMDELLKLEKEAKVELESVDYLKLDGKEKIMSLKEFLQYKQAYKC